MNELMIFIPGIMVMLLGIAIGMYISSQIKCHIRRNILNNNIKKYNEKEKTE